MWILPILVVGITLVLAVPLGRYLSWIMDGRYTPSSWLRRVEGLIDTGPQDWKRYAYSLLIFNTTAFLVGSAILATQPLHPAFLNPDCKGMLSPSTIFNTACSFLTNTNLQHYAGEVHLSYGSQLFFVGWKQFVTPAIGLAALVAMIRGLRGDDQLGNYYLDVWRGTVYVMLPLSLAVALLLLPCGVPMTLEGTVQAGQEPGQQIARGPVAALVAVKQLGTNGGGFFGTNSCHPFENPNAASNLLECVCIILLPFAVVGMFGRMIGNRKHALIVGGVMLGCLVTLMTWAVVTDAQCPNPAFLAQPHQEIRIPGRQEVLQLPALPALPVDQTAVGNLEGKELRFGPGAGPTWATLTTCTSNGSVNCMHDSLNPLSGIAPFAGMMLNCNFGGVGVGFINMLVFLIVGVFLAGLMVGRTPEYLGKKVEAREMKLAMLALLVHPVLVLFPTGLFALTDWGTRSTNNPGAHGYAELLYEFTSASANNGSGFEGLADTFGFNDAKANPTEPAPFAPHWDIVCGLIMLLGRYIPIIAPLALAASLAGKKRTPFTAGTLRTDTLTFGFLLLGTILLVGALLFLPALVLGPIAEHFGPVPFGG